MRSDVAKTQCFWLCGDLRQLDLSIASPTKVISRARISPLLLEHLLFDFYDFTFIGDLLVRLKKPENANTEHDENFPGTDRSKRNSLAERRAAVTPHKEFQDNGVLVGSVFGLN